MATPEDVEYLREAIAPLCAPLYANLAFGVEIAEAHLMDYGLHDDAYRPIASHLARAHARHLTERAAVAEQLGGWQVGPSTNNAQFKLVKDATMSLRVLRAVPFGAVPPPGNNRARVAYYSGQAATLFGPQASDLVATWWAEADGELVIRLVRPCGRWSWGKAAKVDIDLVLPRAAGGLEDLEFIPDDENLTFDWPLENEQEDGESGAGGLGG